MEGDEQTGADEGRGQKRAVEVTTVQGEEQRGAGVLLPGDLFCIKVACGGAEEEPRHVPENQLMIFAVEGKRAECDVGDEPHGFARVKQHRESEAKQEVILELDGERPVDGVEELVAENYVEVAEVKEDLRD